MAEIVRNIIHPQSVLLKSRLKTKFLKKDLKWDLWTENSGGSESVFKIQL